MGSINASVDLRRDGEIFVVTADNPPVNALKHEVRAGLAEGLKHAREDTGVKAVVIVCAGRTFFAGADITEFGKPPQAPSLHDVIAAIEAMPKPVVAALHGTALGGGFELALACHFRVAVPAARVGLPEVKLGLLPGAGGTQRLPRLVGPEKALEMIVTGEPIGAAEARVGGIIDEIVEGDLTAAAIDFARRVVHERRPLRLVRDRDEKLIGEGFADAAEALTRRLRGRDAPAACVEAVRNAIVLPFEEGLRRESELFRKLVAGDQSKAQRHIFFAEREAAKVPHMPEATRPRPIAQGAVIGAGTMGGGIAMCFANAGIPVTVVETDRDLLQKGLDRVAANYRTMRENLRLFGALITWMGFKTGYVRVAHGERFEGQSTYTLRKLFKLAFETIIAYSDKPLRLAVQFGALISFLAFVVGLYVLGKGLFEGRSVAGWSSVMVSLSFLGGIIIAILGIIGVYLGKIYEETKQRPLYLVRRSIGFVPAAAAAGGRPSDRR